MCVCHPEPVEGSFPYWAKRGEGELLRGLVNGKGEAGFSAKGLIRGNQFFVIPPGCDSPEMKGSPSAPVTGMGLVL